MGRFNKDGTEVIFFTEPVDNFLMMNVHEYKVTAGEGDAKKDVSYHFVPIDTTEADLKHEHDEGKDGKEGEKKDDKAGDKKEPELPAATKKFLEVVKSVLGVKILDAKVSDKLYDSPYRLANPAGGMTSSMQRVMRFWTRKMQDKEFEIPRKVLEFNKDHPMVQELIDLCDKDPDNGRIKPVLLQVLDTCLLAEGDLPDPASMVPRMNQLLEMLVRRRDDVKNPAEDLPQTETKAEPEAEAGSEVLAADKEEQASETDDNKEPDSNTGD
jgi:molecular chaperone HtpG